MNFNFDLKKVLLTLREFIDKGEAEWDKKLTREQRDILIRRAFDGQEIIPPGIKD